MDKKTNIENRLRDRDREREKLFDLMFQNASEEKVKEQFAVFEKAHKEALRAYEDAA